MPNLPTITVTTAQAAQVLAAFGDAATYQEWLRTQVVEYVVRVEQARMQADAADSQLQMVARLRADLGLTPMRAPV